MTISAKWQPAFLYSVGDMFVIDGAEQPVLSAGRSGLVEPPWKRKRGEYTDDAFVKWECAGKLAEAENDQ